jgi:hypothetical protein
LRVLKSSSVIFTFTWTVLFIPPISGNFSCYATILIVPLVPFRLIFLRSETNGAGIQGLPLLC